LAARCELIEHSKQQKPISFPNHSDFWQPLAESNLEEDPFQLAEDQLRRSTNADETADKSRRDETPMRSVPAFAVCGSLVAGLLFVRCNNRGFVASLLPSAWKAQVLPASHEGGGFGFNLW
jgi:hypothetical protein